MLRSSRIAVGIVAALWLTCGVLHAQTVDEIIATNLKSKGGLEKIRATTSVRMTGSVVARDMMSGRELTGTMTMVAKRPNLMRRDVDLGGQRVVNGFDGSTLWMAIGNAPPQQVPSTQNAYSMQDAEFDSVFVDYKEKGQKIELVGKETADGTPVYHLKVTKKNGPPQDYYLDADTGLERKISVAGRGPDGSQMLNVTEFADYRSVDGGMVPFVLKQRQNGTLIATTTVDKVEFNLPIEDALFRMPAK